jgi:CubicO group peptidase (beta-lactamase class C family)
VIDRPKYIRAVILGIVAWSCVNSAICQNPGAHWQRYKTVREAGFSQEGLDAAKAFYDSLPSSAFMVVCDGKVVLAWGEVNRRFIVHSIRKSLLNSLYGIYVARGVIDTNLTIGQLGITENDSLSALEQSARISFLLRSRSGVYHPAAAETDWQRTIRPKRNSHLPDTFWFYNNWDFNVLGAILEKLAKASVYEAFYQDIAVPLQMEDYRVMDGEYFYQREYSRYPAYHLKMSARDLARYGQLFLQYGEWNGKRILPDSWVKTSTYPHSKHGGGTKIGRWYGYLWGVSEYYSRYGMYFASGVGGQFLAVFPTEKLVFVHLCNTYLGKRVLDRDLTELFDLVLAARVNKPSGKPELVNFEPKGRIPSDADFQGIDVSKYVGTHNVDGRMVTVVDTNGTLLLEDYDMKFRLFPFSPLRFFAEDLEKYVNVEFDGTGRVSKISYEDADVETQ